MKKNSLIVLLIAFFCAFGGTTNALSCASFPTFEEMAEDAEVMFSGELISKTFAEDTSDAEYCEGLGSDSSTLGLHSFTFNVHEVHTGTVGNEITVTKEVTGTNCTRGGGCIDMVVGKSYKVITNSANQLGDGLCSACPYLVEEVEQCLCTMQYDPVCGTDRITYGNKCQLECAEGDVKVRYYGECEPAQEGIDNSCITWYDGCNTCSAMNGTINECTEMACLVQQRAKCTQYNYVYLNETLLSFIETKLNNFLDNFSGTEKEERISLLIEKIASMKNDLLFTLSTTSFVQGSSALREIEITLEVLNALDSML